MMARRRLAIALCLACLGAAARAEEVPFCFDYGCTTLEMVRLEPAQLKRVESLFAGVDSPAAERRAIAAAMAWLYSYAGEQTLAWLDRGGNIDDEQVPGRMDCIDHSTNTTTWLALLERRGLMRFHTVAEPVRRGNVLTVHWSARVLETAGGGQWAVDTWFLDPGYPAAIYPLAEWMRGAHPPGTEPIRLR
jgi:hypothetical protein